MPQEIKTLNLKLPINIDTTPADLMEWDAQSLVLENTGIERDGGVTNLYTQVESNSQYDQTYYTKKGSRVRLMKDAINNTFRIYSNTVDVGKCPLWGVKSRKVVTLDANDVLVTTTGTLLILRIASDLATIEEVDSENTILQARSFTIPSAVSDGFFVRNKAPTYANVTSIVGVYASANRLYHEIITDGGVVYAATGQVGFINSGQVFAYYEHGWIVCANDKTDGRTFLFNSAGAQQGSYTEATMLVANYTALTNTVSFVGYRDVVTLGTNPGTYGKTFTPPASDGAAWTITDKTNGLTAPQSLAFTFGGQEIIYNATGQAAFFNNNNSADRTWTINHSTCSEIYGCLDSGADVSFKVHTILGDASYISASFNVDGIGVPITEVGELNAFYYPQILKCSDGCYNVIYRRGNGSFCIVNLSNALDYDRMQEIAPGVVKINTTSALCVVDSNKNDLEYSGNAYNGFVIVGFSTASPTAQKGFVARYRGDWGGSVDTNFKSTGAVVVGAPNLVVIPESVSYTPNNETIDVYIGPPPSSLAYFRSIRDGIAQSIKGSLNGTIYVDDSIIPPPIGADYYDRTIKLIGSTAIREQDYDGYQNLNEVVGQFDSFTLFGQLYLYDGEWIYSTTLSANVLTAKNKVANALGLHLLTETPNVAYFLSEFDNSLFTFDGGQTVSKQSRFTQKGTIRKVVFNSYENTLGIFLDDSVIWNRDGIMTESFLPIEWPYDVQTTADGIWITQNRFAIKYLYNAVATNNGGEVVVIALELDGGTWGNAYTDTYDGGAWGTSYADTVDGAAWGTGGDIPGVVDSLTWKSQFLGYSEKTKQNVDRYTLRVYKQDKEPTTATIEYQCYYDDGTHTETVTLPVGDPVTSPYDANGYAFIEYIPAAKNAIASSIKITIPDKIVLIDLFATVTPQGETIAKNRG